MDILNISTHSRTELIDITGQIQGLIKKNKWQDGVLTVFVPHTTAGVTINENADPSVQRDVLKQLSKLAPVEAGYIHSEGNSDGHVKSSLVGCSLNIIVENGAMALGTWQGVYFAEFDGPRSRKVQLKFLSDK
ncbi:MAG: secondary thiamine-phosphate synthase enzyme YjbQ [Candidatus Brocadiia bacterium]